MTNNPQIKYQQPAPADPLDDPDYEPPPPTLSNGFFAWFSPVIHMKEEQMISQLGKPLQRKSYTILTHINRLGCDHFPAFSTSSPQCLLRHITVRNWSPRRQYHLQPQIRRQR